MNYNLGDLLLRRPEVTDLEALYTFKNDPEIAGYLDGFSTGYSMPDLQDWLEYHRKRTDEVLWVIASQRTNECLGHVGLYRIDHRIRSAEFGILIGKREDWGKGYGKTCTRFAVQYGFNELNLNRIYLHVLKSNVRAIRLYESVGFSEEGVARQAQFKNGQFEDILLMGLLKGEFKDAIVND